MLIDALSVGCRALSFIALFQAAGAALFIALFGRELTSADAAIRKLGIVFAWAGIALVLLHYALEAGRIGGELAGVLDPAYQRMVMDSPQSAAAALRATGLLLIALGLRNATSRGTALALAGAALAAIAFALVGHTAAHETRWLLAPLLLAHIVLVAFWFGALLPLVLVCGREPAGGRAQIVERFSKIAFWLVPMLALAGFLLAVVMLPGLSALTQPYGLLLLAKVAGFAVLMLLAALNKWRLAPALRAERAAAGIAFRRSVLAEYALIAAILIITATLTTFYSPDA